jgi:hypothetical protein
LGNTPIRARTLALWPLRMGNNSRRRAGCQCHRGVAYESLRALESLLCPVTLTPTSLSLSILYKKAACFLAIYVARMQMHLRQRKVSDAVNINPG